MEWRELSDGECYYYSQEGTRAQEKRQEMWSQNKEHNNVDAPKQQHLGQVNSFDQTPLIRLTKKNLFIN